MWNLLIFLLLNSLGKIVTFEEYKCDPNRATILEMLDERFGELNDPIWKLIDKIPYEAESIITSAPQHSTTCPKPKHYPRTCGEMHYSNRRSGIHAIELNTYSDKPFLVFCDNVSHGGGWMVIQRRLNGSIDFFREWMSYKIGFGNLNGEFWLGLDKLHALTVDKPQELLIMLTDWNGNKGISMYNAFEIGNETEKYKLKVLGAYKRGNAGDALRYHLGQPFATKDNDNSHYCASGSRGAWWYNDCHESNLNGLYLKEDEKNVGMSWAPWRDHTSLKETKMMIRPKK